MMLTWKITSIRRNILVNLITLIEVVNTYITGVVLILYSFGAIFLVEAFTLSKMFFFFWGINVSRVINH